MLFIAMPRVPDDAPVVPNDERRPSVGRLSLSAPAYFTTSHCSFRHGLAAPLELHSGLFEKTKGAALIRVTAPVSAGGCPGGWLPVTIVETLIFLLCSAWKDTYSLPGG